MGPFATGPGLPAGSDPIVARAVARLRIALGLSTLAMLGLSWPLWFDLGEFPRVPFAPALAGPPAAISWIPFAVLLGMIAAATVGIAWRACLGLSLVVLAYLVLRDQERFQPWAYQYGMVALLLAALPERRALLMIRWWTLSIYAYSGLSKLDVSFCRELGGRFLEVAARPLGLDPATWPTPARSAAILAMPAWEIAVALGLGIPATRRLGRAGAAVLHVALILILGPWGMGHSTIVLAWNAAMLAEVWIAFDPAVDRRPAVDRAGRLSAAGWLAQGAFLAGIVLPIGERRGFCDAWPAHALYASHVERTEVYLHEDELPSYPAGVRRHARPAGPGPWLRLDLTGWSRDERGVPVYPQARACNGLAESLASRYGDHHLIRVVHEGRADCWSGHRTRFGLLGLDEIRRQGSRYRLNAHPARDPGWSGAGPVRSKGPRPGP